MNTSNTVAPQGRPLAVLSALILLAGAGGMAISFLYLMSDHHFDIMAGMAGFVAGALLVGFGLLSLALRSTVLPACEAVACVEGCLLGTLPPLTAIVGWPLGFGVAGLLLVTFVMPVVMLVCIAWSIDSSHRVANHICRLNGWSRVRLVQGVVFVTQVLGIIASMPLFGEFCEYLRRMGYKVGWS